MIEMRESQKDSDPRNLTAWKRILFKEHNFCGWCKKPLLHKKKNTGTEWNSATLDHIIQKSDGGPDMRFNFKVSCLRCNNGREIFGGCIGAFACASAIVGKNATVREIQDTFLRTGNAKKRLERSQPGYRFDHRFYHIDKYKLYATNRPMAIVKPNAKTRILYEGTEEYKELIKSMWTPDTTKGEKIWSRRVTAMARDSGYDAIWWLKKGLMVFNLSALECEFIPKTA